MKDLEIYNDKIFDDIKHMDLDGNEFWYARELQHVLEYKLWQNFDNVIKLAMNACKLSNFNIKDHFIDVNKMIVLGKGGKREINDYKLSRYACYTHYKMGKIVREAIIRAGGTMPENLPLPQKSIKDIEKSIKNK